MATAFAPSGAPVAPPPFLLSPDSVHSLSADLPEALRAAVIAEARTSRGRRERCRIATLLCELACQLGARGRSGLDLDLPLSRTELAGLLGVSLVRVKRALGLLSLSRVIETDGRTIRVTDWRRLCGVASFDRSRLGISDDQDDTLCAIAQEDDEPRLITAAGDQACFV